MKIAIADLIKRGIRDRFVQLKGLRRPSIRYCIENNLLPSLLTQTPTDTVRKIFNLPSSEHRTQLNQDLFALIINQFRTGFFIEIGANDGFTLSNTVYLEEKFGWKGILIEANNKYMPSLAQRKNSVIVSKAISSKKGKAEFVDAGLYGGLKASLDNTHHLYTASAACIMVDCISLQEILDTANAPDEIDFVSIDVEGGEVAIVEQLISVSQRFRCGCVEYNKRTEDYKRIGALLKAAGYKVVWENQTQQDLFFVNDVVRWPK